MTDLLKDKVAVIFGGTGHVGSVICELLAFEGAKVVVHYNSRSEKAHNIVNNILNKQGKAIFLAADITDQNEVKGLIDKTIDTFGKINIVVNTVHKEFIPILVGDMKWQDWNIHLDALKAHFNICSSVLPQMRKQHNGQIIFISGGLSYRLFKGCAAYTTIKAGLNGFCKTLALEEGENGITVNIVAPGRVTEEGSGSLMSDTESWDSIEKEQISKTPLGRSATAKDVANAVLYFASPLSSCITGQTIFVTGGELMPMP